MLETANGLILIALIPILFRLMIHLIYDLFNLFKEE